MKWRPLVFTLLTTITLLACQFVTGPFGPTAVPAAGSPVPATRLPATPSPAKAGVSKQYQYVFGPPRNPIHLKIELDQAHSAHATLSGKGGSLTVTGADGTQYALDVPAQALPSATPITMTVVSSLTGLPFGGKTYAVQMAPEGVYFY